MTTDRKRPGRPPLDPRAPSAGVYLKISGVDYEKAEAVARRDRESIQDVIRRGLRRLLDERP